MAKRESAGLFPMALWGGGARGRREADEKEADDDASHKRSRQIDRPGPAGAMFYYWC